MLTVLKNGGPTVIFVAAHPLGDDREERSPEHGERDADEHEIVVEKRRLAAHHALELRLRLEVLEPRRDEVDRRRPSTRRRRSANQVPTGDCANECTLSITPLRVMNVPKIASRKVDDDEHDVPLPQHAALFLDHDRVEERRAGEPREERRVLDRIPRPVAAPSQLDVRPPHAERDADGEEEPGDERPAPHGRSHSASSLRVISAAIANANGIAVAT